MIHRETLSRGKKINKIVRSCFQASTTGYLFIWHMWVVGKEFLKEMVCGLKRLQDLRWIPMAASRSELGVASCHWLRSVASFDLANRPQLCVEGLNFLKKEWMETLAYLNVWLWEKDLSTLETFLFYFLTLVSTFLFLVLLLFCRDLFPSECSLPKGKVMTFYSLPMIPSYLPFWWIILYWFLTLTEFFHCK